MTNENFQVYDESHSDFFIIQSVLDDILDSFEMRLYVALKRIAGEKGKCTMSRTRLAERCKMSIRKLIEVKKRLTMPFKEIGIPLIKVSHRLTEKGDPDTDAITLVNLWHINHQYFLEKRKMKGDEKTSQNCSQPDFSYEQPLQRENGLKNSLGVVHEVHEGGAPGAPKEDQLEEDPIRNTCRGSRPSSDCSQPKKTELKPSDNVRFTQADPYCNALDPFDHPYRKATIKGKMVSRYESLSEEQKKSFQWLINVPSGNLTDKGTNPVSAIDLVLRFPSHVIEEAIQKYKKAKEKKPIKVSAWGYIKKVCEQSGKTGDLSVKANKEFWEKNKHLVKSGIPHSEGVRFPDYAMSLSFSMHPSVFKEEFNVIRQYEEFDVF